MAEALEKHKAVVVIGAGTMGSGIAEVAACAGHRVYLRDTSAAALDRGIGQIRASLDKRVQRGKVAAAERDATVARLMSVGPDAKLDGVGLVIEVIVENLDVKVAVLRQIESEVDADTIIATKKVSVLADVPGLAVTRTVAMLVNEAADAVNQDIASADDIDAAMQKGVNYPIGPMAWGRRLGFAHVAAVLGHLGQAYGEDRYRISPWLRRAVHAAQPLGASHG